MKMGGCGSGRRYGKRKTSSVTSINIKTLDDDERAHGSVSFRYTLDGKPKEHTVTLAKTACHYGGVRYWFKCPYCPRCVAVLYLSGGQCACRHCFKLAYQSECETDQDRLFRKANHIRATLGWQRGIAYPKGDKPKGMHWKTFNRMKATYDLTVQRIIGYDIQWLEKINSRRRASL
jgi:hypothetical protein